MEPKNVNDAALGRNGIVIDRRAVQVVELGADSKRLLMEIRDRLPAATPPPSGDRSGDSTRDDLWMSIRNGLEVQLMNAEDVPSSLLDGARLDRMADGIRGKIEWDGTR